MNRAERRKMQKDLRKTGMSKEQAKAYVEKNYGPSIPMEEGQLVKLNYNLMVAHPEWKNQEDAFKLWVTAHRDKVFTVEWDPNRVAANTDDIKTNVQLKEDETEDKWIFNTATLIPIASAKIKLDNGKEIKVPLEGVTNPDDTRVQESINKALEEEGENINGSSN